MVRGIHRSDVVFEDLQKAVPEVGRIINSCASLSSFFHKSGTRTEELNTLAKQESLYIRRIPKYFEVRFAQYTQSLVESILAGKHTILPRVPPSAS